jgi:hypothetical protein
MQSQRYSTSFALALIVAALSSAVLVVIKEVNPALKEWMKMLTGHHWVTHAVLTLSVFVVLGIVLAQFEPARSGRVAAGLLATLIAVVVVTGSAIVAGFYGLK